MDITAANPIRERWKRGEVAIAMTLRQLRNADAAYVAQACGFDAVVVDCEHATFSAAETSCICLAARALGLGALVRLSGQSAAEIGGALDGGASGIIVPHVESAAEAEAVAQAARFPPQGHRSVAAIGPSMGYRTLPALEAMRVQNDAVLVVAMLESRRAVQAADEIAAVDGIDAVVVGSADLAAELGLAGQSDHPDVVAGSAAAAEACRRHRKVFTMTALGDDRALQRALLDMGAKLMLAGIDTAYLMSAARRDADALRALAASRSRVG